MSEPLPCPFCTVPHDRILFESDTALAIRDAFPVSPGHTLIIPKRHVASLFECTEGEQAALLKLLNLVRMDVDREFQPSGYNVGVNDGVTAGQTVMHLHVHLIPRYEGDAPDPRGGVRWVLPEKAAYWTR